MSELTVRITDHAGLHDLIDGTPDDMLLLPIFFANGEIVLEEKKA